MFFDVFLNVLAIIGIIAVGAFVIVFLSDLLISIVDSSNGIFFRRAGSKKQKYDSSLRPKLLPPAVEEDNKTLEVEKVKEYDEPVVDDFVKIDYERAKKEEEELKKKNAPKVDEEERLRLIRERRREFEKEAEEPAIVPPPPPVVEEKVKEDEKIIKEIDKSFEEVSKIALMEEIDAERQKLQKQIEELNKFISSKDETINTLQKDIETLSNSKQAEEATIVVGSKEEMQERLDVLRVRLKDKEKAFSKAKKEFIPLQRVAKTLENDTKKLRRKEAIVAKQKVQLYGVNNYVDIDEEKAKKLAEDLDLLEGLRLSVKHCEDVISANKDRYPILEKNYNMLKADVELLKTDIADLETKISMLDKEENKEEVTDEKDGKENK